MPKLISTIKGKLKGLGSADRVILSNVLAAALIRGSALFVSLATVPAFMRFFSNDAILGVWYTVVSVMTWILSFDLGIGNGLRNKLVLALDEHDEKRCRELISSAYASVGAFCLVFLAILAILIKAVDWNAIYGISEGSVDGEALEFVTAWVMGGMLVQLLLKNANSILYALQMSAVNNLISLCVSVLQLAFISIFPPMDEVAALKVMAVAYAVISNLPLFAVTITLFATKLRFARPSIAHVTKEASSEVFGLGMAFFLAQVLYMFIANTNEVFISFFFGSEYVVEYQVYYRLYSLAGMVVTLALTPVWSAVTLAVTKRDYAWLSRTFRRFELLTMAVAAFELLLVPCTQSLFGIWLGDNSLVVAVPYALAFAAFGALFAYQGVVATFANGLGELSTQIVCYSIGFAAKLAISVAASYAGQAWIFVIVGDVLALVPFCLAQRRKTTRFMRRMLSTSKG